MKINLNTASGAPTTPLLIENYIGKKELAQKLSISVSYVNKLMRKKQIRFHKFGRAVRFKFTEVVAALQRSSV